MKWTPTHIVKRERQPPTRLMLNSGAFYTRNEWEECLDPSITLVAEGDAREEDGERIEVHALTQKSGPSGTQLSRPVKRVTRTEIVHKGRRRRLIVTLLPGDVVEMRLEGCRERRVLPLSDLWDRAGHVQALVAMRAAREKRKKKSI